VLIIVAVMFVARNAVRFNDSGRGRESGTTARANETNLTADNADQVIASGGDTQTLIKSFPLTDTSKVMLETLSGDIVVKVWDKSEAVVRVTRKGSDDRRSPVFYKTEGGNLAVRAGGRSNAQFEVTLPRKLAGLDVTSASGDIEVTDAPGAVSVNNTSGTTEIRNVPGLYRVKAISGDLDISLGGEITTPLSIDSTSGEVLLRVKPELNADLDITSVSGDIRADDSLGITVQGRPPSRSGNGVIGKGGTRINVKTVSGDIKVRSEDQR
jgi:DUF4097 and DUF4098 domain-containing protein YvlB